MERIASCVDNSAFSDSETLLTERTVAALKAHRVSIVVFVIVCTVLGALNHVFRPMYQAKAVLLVQRAENSPLQAMMGKMTGNPNFGAKKNEYLEKYLYYLNSHEFFIAAARTLSRNEVLSGEMNAKRTSVLSQVRSWLDRIMYERVEDPSAAANDMEDLASFLDARTQFTKSNQDNITVIGRSRDSRQAVEVANLVAGAAVAVISESELKELNDAKTFITTQLTATSARLRHVDTAIVDYRKRTPLVKSDGGGRDALEPIQNLRRNIETNQIGLEQNQRLIALLQEEQRKQESVIFTKGAKGLPSGDDVVAELRDRIQALQYKRMLFQVQGLSEDSAQIASLEQEMDKLAARVKAHIRQNGGNADDVAPLLIDKDGVARKIAGLKRENQYLVASIETLRKALAEASRPIDALPAAQQKMVEFNRDSSLEFALMQEMRKKILEIELERVALNSKVRVLELATIAGLPARLAVLPKSVLAALIAFLLALGGAVAYDHLSTTFKSRRELEPLGVVTLGSVPIITPPSPWRRFFGTTATSHDLLQRWRLSEESGEVMALKHIRATVMKMRTESGEPAKVFCVLGSAPGDGKSFISTQLAFALAQTGGKTLLLDCDLRRPTVCQKLELRPGPGLTSVLEGKNTIDDVITPDVVPGLDVAQSGPHVGRASELLGDSRFADLLAGLRGKYRFIVVDTPPLLPVVDGLVVAGLSDSMILVCSHRKTRRPDVRQAIEKIRHMDPRPIFVVYNRAEWTRDYYYHYDSLRQRSGDRQSPPGGPSVSLADEIERFRKTIQGNKPGEIHGA